MCIRDRSGGILAQRRPRQEVAGRRGRGASPALRRKRMVVHGQLRGGQCHVLYAALLAYDVGLTPASPRMDRRAAAQVGQREGVLAVAAVRGADQVEQHFVIRDGQQLAVAHLPAAGSKVEADQPNLAYICLLYTSRCV